MVGEIIGRKDPWDSSERPHSLAEIDGLTREQLLDVTGGRRALWAWERGDDSDYSRAMEAWMRDGDIEEVHMLAETGNRWAQELVDAGLPDEDFQCRSEGDHSRQRHASDIERHAVTSRA